jgi:predicted HNH restriction endonuclease
MLPGEPVFLLRQGAEPRGIFGFGRVTGTPWEGRHWKLLKKRAVYVDILIEDLVDPASQPILAISQLKRLLPRGNWEPRASGQRVSPQVATALHRKWQEFRGGRRLVLGGAAEEAAAFEGELKRGYVSHRRRENSLRAAKLLAFRATHSGRLFCEVPGCGFDFGRRYGEIAGEYAQVHHLRPLASAGSRTRTRLADLGVVCANCHAVIHLGGQCRSLEEVGRLIRGAR